MRTAAFRGPTTHHDPGGMTASGHEVLSGADPSGEHFLDGASDVPDAPPTPAKHFAGLNLLVGVAAPPPARSSPLKKLIKGRRGKVEKGVEEGLLTTLDSEDESSSDDDGIEERLQAARAMYQTVKKYDVKDHGLAGFSDPVLDSRSDAVYQLDESYETPEIFANFSDPVLDSRSTTSVAESQDPPAEDMAWQVGAQDVAPTPRVSNASPSHRIAPSWNVSEAVIPAPPTSGTSRQGRLFSSDFEENRAPFDFPLSSNHQSIYTEGSVTVTNTSGVSHPRSPRKSPDKSASNKSSRRRSNERSGSALKLRRGPVSHRAKTPEKSGQKTPSNGERRNGQAHRGRNAKRGFFRKLFNKKSKPDDYTSVVSDRSQSLKSFRSERATSEPVAENIGHRKSSSLSGGASTISSQDERREDKFSSVKSLTGREEGRVVAENIDAVARDRPQVFYANDEVSTLTNPTLDAPSTGTGNTSGGSTDHKDAQDPSVYARSSSEPQGQYVATEVPQASDPFKEFFFEEPKVVSPTAFSSVDRPVRAKGLRVLVQPSTNDPVGDSPFTSSTARTTLRRNFKDPTPRRAHSTEVCDSPKIKDPKGHSPLHEFKRMPSDVHRTATDFSPDPPLNLGSESDSSISLGKGKRQFSKAQERSLAARKTASSLLPRSPALTRSAQSKIGKVESNERARMKNLSGHGPKVSTVPNPSPKHLDMLTAAKLNAKAVAYLHQINGDPSPRHYWNDVDAESDASSAFTSDLLFGEKKGVGASQSRLLTAYNEGKFKSRNKAEVNASIVTKSDLSSSSSTEGSQHSRSVTGRVLLSRRYGKESFPSNPLISTSKDERYSNQSAASKKNVDEKISHYSVARGIELFRQQREFDVATGRATRVVLRDPKAKAREPTARKLVPLNEPKDPIERASFRLLSKTAVPIQAACRRFLAQAVAVDRMWAVYEIQSYMRRWRAEAVLFASIVSAVTIQAIFRGYIAQKKLRRSKDSAIIIQKIVRGFLVANRTYASIYNIVLVQAQVRGWVTRLLFRRHMAAVESKVRVVCAFRIQTWWRSRSARMLYQFLVVDTIIAQSIVRRYIACKRVKSLTDARDTGAATILQTTWRAFSARRAFKKRNAASAIQKTWRAYGARSSYNSFHAARKIQSIWRGYQSFLLYKKIHSAVLIQAAWRGFQVYTDYIFCLVDILLIQRTIRTWLANRRLQRLQRETASVTIQTAWRKYSVFTIYQEYRSAVLIQKRWRAYSTFWSYKRQRAAVKIQAEWRSYSTFTDYIFSLADIIRTQRVVRAWVIRKNAKLQKTHWAATKIQAVWKGHRVQASYQDYIAARTIQTEWRRHSAYVNFIFSLAHIIVVQSVARSYLSRKEARTIRGKMAATVIQKHWRRYSAQSSALRQLASTLLLQSAVRRHNAVKVATFKRSEAVALIESHSAMKIQSAFRGLGDREQLETFRNGIVRLQSIVRGDMFRKDFNLQLGCCILIQSAVRGFLVRMRMVRTPAFATMLQAQSIRDNIACKKIQFWWRVVMECQREKAAALVIERFFLKIKMDIEDEILRRQTKKASSKEKKQKHHRLSSTGEDELLERAWLNTVDSNSNTDIFAFSSGSGSDIFNFSPSTASISSKSRHFSPRHGGRSPKASGFSPSAASQASGLKHASPGTHAQRSKSPSSHHSGGSSKNSAPKQRRSVGHRASSPPINLVMRHENERRPSSTRKTQQRPKSTKSHSTVSSNRSSSAALSRAKAIAQKAHRNAELVKKLSLEGPFHDSSSDVGREKQTRSSTVEHYRKKFGIQSAPHRVERFFADDLTATEDDATMFSSHSIEVPPRSSRDPAGRPASRPGLRSRMSEPTRNAPPHIRPSPRHGKIRVMNPYPDGYPKVDRNSSGEVEEFFGEEFSEI